MNKKVLITGFTAFGGDLNNPSETLLDWLKSESFNFELITKLLPVSFTHAYPELEKSVLEHRPTHVVLCGLAKNRNVLTIERIGINWVDARFPDNDGVTLKTQKILPAGADGYFTTLPIEGIFNAAQKEGVPVKISTSAGEYVCNYLIYSYLANFKDIPATFIHLPGASDYEVFFKGIRAILNAI